MANVPTKQEFAKLQQDVQQLKQALDGALAELRQLKATTNPNSAKDNAQALAALANTISNRANAAAQSAIEAAIERLSATLFTHIERFSLDFVNQRADLQVFKNDIERRVKSIELLDRRNSTKAAIVQILKDEREQSLRQTGNQGATVPQPPTNPAQPKE